MSLVENLIKDFKRKLEHKRNLSQPSGVLPVTATPAELDREQAQELNVLFTEMGSMINSKQMELLKKLSKDAEPE